MPLLLKSPQVDAALQLWRHQGRVEGQQSAGNIFPDAPQGTIALLGLLEHNASSWTSYCPPGPRVLFHKAAFQHSLNENWLRLLTLHEENS